MPPLQRGAIAALSRAQSRSSAALSASSLGVWERSKSGINCSSSSSSSKNNNRCYSTNNKGSNASIGSYTEILSLSLANKGMRKNAFTGVGRKIGEQDDSQLDLSQPPLGTSRLSHLPQRGPQKQWLSQRRQDSTLPSVMDSFGEGGDDVLSILGNRSASSKGPLSSAYVMDDSFLNDDGIKQYQLHVNARSKNCIMTLVDEKAEKRAGISSGLCGFRNSAEGTYEAGYQCAVRMFEALRKEIERRPNEHIQVEICMKGFGQGRTALLKALSMSEGDGIRESVNKLTDKTAIKIGGVRLKKKRRL